MTERERNRRLAFPSNSFGSSPATGCALCRISFTDLYGEELLDRVGMELGQYIGQHQHSPFFYWPSLGDTTKCLTKRKRKEGMKKQRERKRDKSALWAAVTLCHRSGKHH